MTERERENLGPELGSILAGPPGSAARFVDDPASLSISPRWDAPGRALTLVVHARGRAETGRCIGRHGAVLDPLEALAQRLNERLGLLIRVRMSEAG
jgi:predicted RNA-binding protein YlqC (UPF0109 family)